VSELPPILEFDPTPSAIIEPGNWHKPIDGIATRAVITWMGDAFDCVTSEWPVIERKRFVAETINNPICEVTIEGRPIVIALASVGAPAAAALFETMIAIGCTTFVAVGSSGGLVPELPPGTVVVPDAAIRDEGVSYHYAPPDRLAYPDPEIQDALRRAFTEAGLAPAEGKVWTTDAFFRETAQKVSARVAEGAVAVDMEAASLATIALFRGVRLGHVVYLADTLHSDEWDPTELIERNTDFRYKLLMTAASACLSLS